MRKFPSGVLDPFLVETHAFTGCGKSRMLHRFERARLQPRRNGSFIFNIPSGLQPARDLLSGGYRDFSAVSSGVGTNAE
jgi:hypothetical protein